MSAPTQKVRPAVQAGRFYPNAPGALMSMVQEFISAARPGPFTSPKAIIAPHAGFSFSGAIAGSAFAPWAAEADRIRRVILLGPSHWLDFRGMALPDTVAMATPLGNVAIDPELVALSLQIPGVTVYDAAHTPEHCLEVELPFLQVVLREFTILPLVIGRETDARICALVESLWGGDETRFVLSSDLSHFLDYDSACRFDQGTATSIESLSSMELTPRRACGFRPIRGFLDAAAGRKLKAAAVDLRNSGDTAGRRNEVVGYGAFHFGPGQPLNPVS